MPTINYDGTGDAQPADQDELLSTARSWEDGASKVFHSLDVRNDVDAAQLVISWEVADSEVEEAIAQLDSALSGLGADLPPASAVATVDYGG